jgi:superoxide reductase
MDRRALLRSALATAVGAGGTLFLPRAVLGDGPPRVPSTPLAGSLYYTRETPGRWKGKAAGHLPVVDRKGSMVTVRTPHPQNGFRHYIVKHLVLDGDFKIVADTQFNPWRDDPVSTTDVYDLNGVAYAVSVCNVHDAWLTPFRL